MSSMKKRDNFVGTMPGMFLLVLIAFAIVLGILTILFGWSGLTAKAEELSSSDPTNTLYDAAHYAYVELDGTESAQVKNELQQFLDGQIQSMKQAKDVQHQAHVGYRISTNKLYEVHFLEDNTELTEPRSVDLSVRIVRQFNVNWHICMPNGLETWGDVYDELATPDGKPLFCIEPGRLVTGLGGYTQTVLPGNITTRMKQGASVGYSKKKDVAHYWNVQTFLWKELGTQFLVNSLYSQGIQSEINQGIANLAKRPSFQNKQLTLKIGQSVTLTDTNSVFRDYEKLVSNTANLNIKRNGNKLTLTATANSRDSGVLDFGRYKIEPQSIAYVRPNSQTLAWLLDPVRNHTIISIKVIKNAPVIVEHRDKFNNQLLKTTKETKLIGSRYAYKPYNPLKIGDKTYLPQTTKTQTGTVKDGTNKVVFYYDLERTITVSHIDKRNNQLIVPRTVVKKRRGQTYSYSPRTDLKKGSYAYRILTPNPVKGTVGGNNIEIKFYYDLPLMNIDFKHIEIYTANAKKGLPVTLKIQKDLLYDDKQKEYDTQKVSVQLTDKNTKKVVYQKEFSLRALPKELKTTIASNFLEKNQHHTYEAKFLGLTPGEVVSHAEKIDTDGYTATEKAFTVTPQKVPVFTYKDVVMTGRDYGKPMDKKYEQFQMNTVKLQAQKTGYGFSYAVQPVYDNECGVAGIDKPAFDLFVDKRLLDTYLDYPVRDKQAKLSLETTKSKQQTDQYQIEQTLPQVFLEKESGNVFSATQKQAKDKRIREPLVDGGRKFYVPIWMDLGDYEVTLKSQHSIGVHEITVIVKDQLPVKAFMFGHVKSPTIQQDEIVFSPVHSDNPFPNGRPSNFSEEDMKWFKK